MGEITHKEQKLALFKGHFVIQGNCLFFMPTLSFKIAYPIIITGIFIIVSLIALNYNNMSVSFYVIFAFLAMYVFFFGFAMGKNFAAPVKKLLEKADGLSKGDFKSRFYSESKDEIGQLSNVFNKIAEALEQSNFENERAKKSIDVRVEAETQPLKEVIGALEQKVQNRTLELQKTIEDLEKFKENSAAKESVLSELRSQIAELKETVKASLQKKKNTEEALADEKDAGEKITRPI